MSIWGEGYTNQTYISVNSNKIILINNGLFLKVIGKDAIICYYLFNIKLNNQIGFLPKNNLDYIFYIFDKLYINYFYLGIYHDFVNNQYDYYLMLANKKYEIQQLIDNYRGNYD